MRAQSKEKILKIIDRKLDLLEEKGKLIVEDNLFEPLTTR